MAPFSLADVGAALAAMSALSAASMGLLDSTKAAPGGGVSRVGLRHVRAALKPFEGALVSAMGPDRWWELVQAHWINGMPKDDQKATVRSLIKLGLNVETAPGLAAAVRINPDRLAEVAGKLAEGVELDESDLNLLGRLHAVMDALLDSGFERADQQYRNVCRFWAGVLSVLLSLIVASIWPVIPEDLGRNLSLALIVGLLAVPVAPVAKDLTSALSAAMKALKAAKAL